MTGNKAYLVEYQDYNGGHVAFGGSKGYISGKGKIKTGKLDFEDVCFVKELQHFNLFSVSQICEKKNKVLFTDAECLVLSPNFKLLDENQVLLRVPRQNNMYNFNLENIVPTGGLACLVAKATIDESNKWHWTVQIQDMDIIDYVGPKGIKREYSNARTPQQNGVAERKNKTLIEAARTMLADSFLPNTFWAEAVSTACYVLNRVQVEESYEGGFSTQDNIDAGKSEIEAEPVQEYFVLPVWSSYTSTVKSSEAKNRDVKPNEDTVYPMGCEDCLLSGSNVMRKCMCSTSRSGKSVSSLRRVDKKRTMTRLLFIKKDKNDIISMIGSLMYLTASRLDIMFAVCACSRFQVTPKTSHLNAVKRIFRYLKGKPKLGLWYPRVSSFDLEAYSDSDYAGANLDRKSTTGGCQFLGRRPISLQCKKQTIMATSTTEAEYVAAANCCGQVL
ncbi:ribonuclease H-like domain-containing protein [Tanacetum coccineum]